METPCCKALVWSQGIMSSFTFSLAVIGYLYRCEDLSSSRPRPSRGTAEILCGVSHSVLWSCLVGVSLAVFCAVLSGCGNRYFVA